MITASACPNFDYLIKEFSIFAEYLGKNASIVDFPDFESGIIKLMNDDYMHIVHERSVWTWIDLR